MKKSRRMERPPTKTLFKASALILYQITLLNISNQHHNIFSCKNNTLNIVSQKTTLEKHFDLILIHD